MTDIDTGDLISHDAQVRLVCCVHGDYAHLSGHPHKSVPVDQCHVVRKADASDRLALLKLLADSRGTGHRPACARRRLTEMGVGYESGAC